jgi:hypothetical protein
VLAVSFAATAAASTTLLQISSDPYTNAMSQHKTEVEPFTFSFGSTIVFAFQVGRIFDGEPQHRIRHLEERRAGVDVGIPLRYHTVLDACVDCLGAHQ